MAQAVGARDDMAVARSFQRGMIIAALLTSPASLALLPAETILSRRAIAGRGAPMWPLTADRKLPGGSVRARRARARVE